MIRPTINEESTGKKFAAAPLIRHNCNGTYKCDPLHNSIEESRF